MFIAITYSWRERVDYELGKNSPFKCRLRLRRPQLYCEIHVFKMGILQAPISLSYWGSYHSLYGPLTAAEIQDLEEAILARKLGRFKVACQIWDEKLPLPHTVPVLAVEKADLEARLGHHRSRLDLLQKALASQEEWRGAPSVHEINLLTILAAAAKVEAVGSLRPALLEARKVKAFLQRRSLEEWSLTEVSIELYRSFCLSPLSDISIIQGRSVQLCMPNV